jgi:hypothetical protein
MRLKLFYACLIFLFSDTVSIAQAIAAVDLSEVETQGDANIPASFPRGTKAMVEYINHQLQYPPKAKAEKRGGFSYVRFIVEQDGTLSNFAILKKEELTHREQPFYRRSIHITDLDEEALRVSRSMPKWVPAKKQGENVTSSFVLKIKFSPGN